MFILTLKITYDWYIKPNWADTSIADTMPFELQITSVKPNKQLSSQTDRPSRSKRLESYPNDLPYRLEHTCRIGFADRFSNRSTGFYFDGLPRFG